jgi:hypothetical protein
MGMEQTINGTISGVLPIPLTCKIAKAKKTTKAGITEFIGIKIYKNGTHKLVIMAVMYILDFMMK